MQKIIKILRAVFEINVGRTDGLTDGADCIGPSRCTWVQEYQTKPFIENSRLQIDIPGKVISRVGTTQLSGDRMRHLFLLEVELFFSVGN